MLRLDTNQPHPIGPVARLGWREDGTRRGSHRGGEEPDMDDDDDAPIHSVLGVGGMTNLTRAPDSGSSYYDRGAGRAEAI